MHLFPLPVVPDVLDVVIIFHDVDALFHQYHTAGVIQLLVVLRRQFDLGGNEGVLTPVGTNSVEIIGSRVDGEHIAIGLKVVSAGYTDRYLTIVSVIVSVVT